MLLLVINIKIFEVVLEGEGGSLYIENLASWLPVTISVNHFLASQNYDQGFALFLFIMYKIMAPGGLVFNMNIIFYFLCCVYLFF